jgi:phage terminase large subunit-like protein
MVKSSPALAAYLNPVSSRKTIVFEAAMGRLEAGSREIDQKEGDGPSAIIIDELHLHRDGRMYRMVKHAMKCRAEPVLMTITTAGTAEDVERKSLCYRRYEYSKAVLAGTIPDLKLLPVIYEAQPSDPIDAPATWRKANPSLGHTLSEDDFAEDVVEARHDPEALALFQQKRLNLWVGSLERYIAKADWDACRGDATPAEILRRNRGRRCYAGLDLATVRDLAAFAAIFPADDDKSADVYVKFWCPAESIDLRSRRDRVPYREWAAAGWIEPTGDRDTDYRTIGKSILRFARRHDLKALYADDYNGKFFLKKLAGRGVNVVAIKQTPVHLSDPTKNLLRLVLSGRLRHGGNPVLDWNAGNLRVHSDKQGNVMPCKKRSPEKVDGIVSLVDALAAWSDGAESDGPSVYESEGIFTIDL